MTLAAVRSIDSPRALRTAGEVEDFEQEVVDQYALAMAAAGLSDGHVSNTRSVIIEFARFLSEPLWRRRVMTRTVFWPSSGGRGAA
jgi:hypothetical protein